MEKKALIEAGRIVNTHGVRGEVKIEVWLDSPQFFKSFKRLVLETGEEKKILSAKTQKSFVIAALEGVADVNAAMALKGKTVSVYRADAALPHGAFFLQEPCPTARSSCRISSAQRSWTRTETRSARSRT